MAKKGFTLIEIIVAIVIIGILAGITTVFFNPDYNNQKKCAENLRIISNAIDEYRQTNGDYPPAKGEADLQAALTTVPAANFVCPADRSGLGDSYSAYYIKRNDYSSMTSFTLGCPRHDNGKSAMNVFYQGQIMKREMSPASYTNIAGKGVSLAPGAAIPAGRQVTFSDGSTALVNSGSFSFVQSFSIGSDKCYSLISSGTNGDVTVHVTPGSKFEVVTPSAIAGVEGTDFRIIVFKNGGMVTAVTYVGVANGTVAVNNHQGKSEAGQGQILRADAGVAPAIIDPAKDNSSQSTTMSNWIKNNSK